MNGEIPEKKIRWGLWLSLAFAVPFFLLAAVLSLAMPGEYAENASISGMWTCPVFAICLLIMSSTTEKWLFPAFISGFIFAGGTIGFLVAAESLDVHSQSYDPDLIHFLSGIPVQVFMYGLPAGFIALGLVWIIRWTIKEGWWTPGKKPQ
ncbi:MAG: hypothetical protein IT343_21965 [Candidatus Melainabacteria bacterium]|jgi:hypothetical protein|nr:hypothetical protein [Candidatus Melainabacteria bacterium]